MLDRGAVFDETAAYRYLLTRRWERDGRCVTFVMLNPSTADAFEEDPTIRRCIGFAQRLGFNALQIVNIFAFRSTDPKKLREVDDPVGPDNDRYIREACFRGNSVICAWGAYAHLAGRDLEAWKQIRLEWPHVYCLGRTKAGHPKHPLYLKATTELERFRPPGSGRPLLPTARAGGLELAEKQGKV